MMPAELDASKTTSPEVRGGLWRFLSNREGNCEFDGRSEPRLVCKEGPRFELSDVF